MGFRDNQNLGSKKIKKLPSSRPARYADKVLGTQNCPFAKIFSGMTSKWTPWIRKLPSFLPNLAHAHYLSPSFTILPLSKNYYVGFGNTAVTAKEREKKKIFSLETKKRGRQKQTEVALTSCCSYFLPLLSKTLSSLSLRFLSLLE